MIPEKIGRYEVKGPLGRGGMATVYQAYDPHFEREVAIKVLPREFMHEPEFLARFKREAKTIAALEHPAIVPVYDYGEDNGQPFLVMRNMLGGSLSDRLAQGAIQPTEAAKILGRIGSALDRAHQQGIVHRDLKPSNILFDQYGDAFLADFGIVRVSSESALTASGSLVGTPAYMSPEQVYGDKELDGRSDIYALGIIVYQMLTGKPPYEADTAAKLMMKHVLDPVPHLIDQRPDLPPQFDFVLSKALAKDREERYPSATEFSTAIVSVTERAERPSMPDVDLSALSPVEPAILTEKESPTVKPTPRPTPASEPQIPPPNVPPPSAASTPIQPPQSDTSGSGIPKWIWGIVALIVFICIAFGAIGLVFVNSLTDEENNTPVALDGSVTDEANVVAPTEASTEVPTVAPTATDPSEALTRESAIAARETAVAEANTTETPASTVDDAEATRESLVATRNALANESATATPVTNIEISPPRIPGRITTLYGPENGEIVHDDDEFLESGNLDLNVADFVASATVGNPYNANDGTWDFGIIFRQIEPDDEMRLVTRSNGDWSLNDRRGEDNILTSGTAVNDLSLNANQTNQFTLITQGDRGFFFLNGTFQDVLDLSTRPESGDIGLATGFYVGSELPGRATTYDDFTVWPLDPEAGPFNNQLDHIDDGLIKIRHADVDFGNFIADTTFVNPYSTSLSGWDFGFAFRDTGTDAELWIVVTSEGDWYLYDRQDGDETAVGQGVVDNLDISDTGENRLTLIAQDDTGYLLVNDVLAAELNLSSHPGTGDIGVMTAYFDGDEVEGEATRYENFTIWPLP